MTSHPHISAIHHARAGRAVRSGRRRNRGSAYIAVLGLMMVLITLASGALLAVRAQSRSAQLQQDTAKARAHALSAIELARLMIHSDLDWRRTRANGTWISNQSIGQGNLSVTVINPLGALNRSDLDPVVITGTGVHGSATQIVRVTLDASVVPYTCMAAAMTSFGAMTFTSTTVNAAGHTLASNGNMTASSSAINATPMATGTVSGGTYNGIATSNVTPRELPNQYAFDYYLANGTNIPVSSLSSSGGSGRWIKDVLLSPHTNPFSGGLNSQGIYVIDCQGQTVTIADCRIVGTIILLNPGTGSQVNSSVVWEPAVTGYPCLMVHGDFAIDMSSSSLMEVVLLGVNYNPSHTPYPYPNGTWNLFSLLNLDSFPSQITGLVYTSGNLEVGGSSKVGMIVSGGTINVSNATLTLSPPSAYSTSPPPGFRVMTMHESAGSWRRGVQ